MENFCSRNASPPCLFVYTNRGRKSATDRKGVLVSFDATEYPSTPTCENSVKDTSMFGQSGLEF